MCLGRGEGRRQNAEGPGQERRLGARKVCLSPGASAVPHLGIRGSSAYWPREGSCQAWRLTMRHSGPDLRGVNRPKPMTLNVCPVPGSRSFPSTMTNQAESKHEVWQGELDDGGRGQMWDVARRPLKGWGATQPSPRAKRWGSQRGPRVTLPPELRLQVTSLGLLT